MPVWVLIVGSLSSVSQAEDMELLSSIRTAYIANRTALSVGSIRFQVAVGSANNATDARRGDLNSPSRAKGFYAYTQSNGRYECIFPIEQVVGARVKVGAHRWSSPLYSFRSLFNGRLTLGDEVIVTDDGKAEIHSAQIDAGPAQYHHFFGVQPFPFSLGTTQRHAYGSLDTDIEKIERGEVDCKLESIDTHAKIAERDVVLMTITFGPSYPGVRYWVDLEQNGIPLQIQVFSYGDKDKILFQVNYDDVRDVSGSCKLPFVQTTFTPPGLVKRLTIEEAAFGPVSADTFRLEFPDPLMPMINMADGMRYEPQKVWDLSHLPSPRSGKAQRFNLPPPYVPPPAMTGPTEPTSWWSMPVMVCGLILVLGAAGSAFWFRAPLRSRLPASNNSRKQAGFTLIELLTAMGIIGILLALLIPAVQGGREVSRRLSCLNNLKQIGVALNSYESVHSFYPAIISQTGAAPISAAGFSAQAYSPLTRMLAELGQVQVYNATNFMGIPTTTASLWANFTVMTTAMSQFVCPSESSRSPTGYGRVNYRFSLGPTPWDAPSEYEPITLAGPFSVHHFYRAASFTDGLSQTIGVSERSQGSWIRGRFTRGDYLLTSTNDGGFHPRLGADWAVQVCSSESSLSGLETRSGESWFLSGLHFTDYNHCATPNPKFYDCSFFDFDEDISWRTQHAGVFSARSNHLGGVNVLRMDGSAQYVKDSVSIAIWRALSTRAMGEIISGSD